MSIDCSRENLSSLSKDGVTDDLFRLLWAKDELNFSPAVNVPDTIVYKYGQPICWYFTSVNGHVKRKNKNNLISAKIEEAFTKHVLGYDVIAYFVSMPADTESSSSAPAASATGDRERNNNGNNSNNNEFNTVIEYLDREGLKKFLYNHRKEVNGLLQRFIEPKSTHNEVIRGIWSPKLCLLERAENIHALHDHRYGLYERCVVYEGPDYYYTSAPLRGPVLSGQIQKLCESTVSHIGEVTFGQKQVSRIVLNFKVDSRDKIWLLYSTSIRTIDMLEYNPIDALQQSTSTRNLLNIDSVVSLAETVHLNPKKSYSTIKPRLRKPCLSCAKEELEEMRHPVTYKAIIKHYDHVLYLLRMAVFNGSSTGGSGKRKPNTQDDLVAWPPDGELIESAGNVGFGALHMGEERVTKQKLRHLRDLQIPPVIAALHPKLVTETYVRCKDDPLFLNRTVHVCEACYLVYAEFQTMLLQLGGNLKKLLTPDPAGASLAMSASGMRSQTSLSTGRDRPTSADWRAISSAASQQQQQFNRSLSAESTIGSLSRSALQTAKERAIGIRANEIRHQPEVPGTIREPSIAHEFNEFSLSTIRTQQTRIAPMSPTNASVRSAGTLFQGGLLENDGQSLSRGMSRGVGGERMSPPDLYDPHNVQAMIAERERRFFKEISLNPQLKDQHPLMHIINAQQRLKLVDEQSGVLMSKTASKSESVFGSSYGRQPGDKHDPYAPYLAEIPVIVSGEIVLPSQLKQRRKQEALAKKQAKKQSMRSFMQPQEVDGHAEKTSATEKAIRTAVNTANTTKSTKPVTDSGAAKTGNAALESNVKSSQKYRDFLAESLKKIQGEVEGAAPFRKTNFIDEHVDEDGTAIPASPSASSRSRNTMRFPEQRQQAVPLSEKGRRSASTSAAALPTLPSKKRTGAEDDYMTEFALADAPLLPLFPPAPSGSERDTNTNTNTNTKAATSEISESKTSNKSRKTQITKKKAPNASASGSEAKPEPTEAQTQAQTQVSTSAVGKEMEKNPPSDKKNTQSAAIPSVPTESSRQSKTPSLSLSMPAPDGEDFVGYSPLADHLDSERDQALRDMEARAHDDEDGSSVVWEEEEQSPFNRFVPGQMLEENSSLLVGGSVEKLPPGFAAPDESRTDENSEGFSVSHSEAFPFLEGESIAGADDSAGHSLEPLSTEFANDTLLSPEHVDRDLLRENASKNLASEQSLIREQASVLLQLSSTSNSSSEFRS